MEDMEAISRECPAISEGGSGWQDPVKRPHDISIISGVPFQRLKRISQIVIRISMNYDYNQFSYDYFHSYSYFHPLI